MDDSDDEKEGRKEKLSLKKGLGSEARAALAANVDADVQLLTPLEQQRARFKQKKRLQGSREGAVCFCSQDDDIINMLQTLLTLGAVKGSS